VEPRRERLIRLVADAGRCGGGDGTKASGLAGEATAAVVEATAAAGDATAAAGEAAAPVTWRAVLEGGAALRGKAPASWRCCGDRAARALLTVTAALSTALAVRGLGGRVAPGEGGSGKVAAATAESGDDIGAPAEDNAYVAGGEGNAPP
jgi:hypothetical protein